MAGFVQCMFRLSGLDSRFASCFMVRLYVQGVVCAGKCSSWSGTAGGSDPNDWQSSAPFENAFALVWLTFFERFSLDLLRIELHPRTGKAPNNVQSLLLFFLHSFWRLSWLLVHSWCNEEWSWSCGGGGVLDIVGEIGLDAVRHAVWNIGWDGVVVDRSICHHSGSTRKLANNILLLLHPFVDLFLQVLAWHKFSQFTACHRASVPTEWFPSENGRALEIDPSLLGHDRIHHYSITQRTKKACRWLNNSASFTFGITCQCRHDGLAVKEFKNRIWVVADEPIKSRKVSTSVAYLGWEDTLILLVLLCFVRTQLLTTHDVVHFSTSRTVNSRV